ncbi:12640_t:CDS:1, partial [Funneliformis mosseae]
MDVRNYTWVNSFEITSVNVTTNSTNSGSSMPQSSQTNGGLVTIIASIGGTLGAVIIMACGFLFYRWNKDRIVQFPEEHKLPG